MALPSNHTLVAGHYNGVFTRQNQVDSNTVIHYVSATAEGFTFSQDVQMEPITTDMLGAVPVEYIYTGKMVEVRCTLQRFDEFFHHSDDTTGFDGTATGYQAHTYNSTNYGIIFGQDQADPGNLNIVGQLVGDLSAGALVLTPAYSLRNSRLPSITFGRCFPVPGSVNFNTKLMTVEVTFRALPYWYNNTEHRLFTITPGLTS